MDLTPLLARLGDDKDREAQDALVAAGGEAVGPVLRLLCDEGSPVKWHVPATVLTRIGDPAFRPLAGAITVAATPEVARRCRWTFGNLRLTDPAIFTTVLDHPHPEVRQTALLGLQHLKAGAEPFLPVLAGLLDDPVADVRQRAIWAIGEVGDAAVPYLRSLRRGAGRKRRGALTALAEIGGWEALDEIDRTAVERLIEVKAAGEVPAPMHLCGFWYALPTTDQAAVLDAFDLTEARPATMRMGESVWNLDQHNWSTDPHRHCRRAYVSPALNGWTLVFGASPEVAHTDDEAARRDHLLRRTAELSARFGAAHWYGASCGDNWTAWCLAEGGEVTRYYDVYEPDEQVGPGHPAEEGYLLPHEDAFPDDAFAGVATKDFAARYAQVKRELGIPDEAHATTVAARASVDPGALGPHTRAEGRAVIALTSCGRDAGSTPGAPAI